jgi:hypothetical protein
MTTVFLSHASQDDKLAEQLTGWLTRNGFTDLFVDHAKIRVGDRWADALRNAKASCRIVICLVSPPWLESDECYGEFMAGWYAGKRILPLLAICGAALNERQHRRLARVLGEDQGFDLATVGAPGDLAFDAHPKLAATLIAGLKAGGALRLIQQKCSRTLILGALDRLRRRWVEAPALRPNNFVLISMLQLFPNANVGRGPQETGI